MELTLSIGDPAYTQLVRTVKPQCINQPWIDYHGLACRKRDWQSGCWYVSLSNTCDAYVPVRLLLLHPQINDTIRDEQGRTPLECAGDAEVSSIIEGGYRETN
jgi:hypothetical protein